MRKWILVIWGITLIFLMDHRLLSAASTPHELYRLQAGLEEAEVEILQLRAKIVHLGLAPTEENSKLSVEDAKALWTQYLRVLGTTTALAAHTLEAIDVYQSTQKIYPLRKETDGSTFRFTADFYVSLGARAERVLRSMEHNLNVFVGEIQYHGSKRQEHEGYCREIGEIDEKIRETENQLMDNELNKNDLSVKLFGRSLQLLSRQEMAQFIIASAQLQETERGLKKRRQILLNRRDELNVDLETNDGYMTQPLSVAAFKTDFDAFWETLELGLGYSVGTTEATRYASLERLLKKPTEKAKCPAALEGKDPSDKKRKFGIN